MQTSKNPSDFRAEPAENGGPPDMSERRRISRRTTAFVLASMALAVAAIVVAIQYFVVEHVPDLTEAHLESAKKRWQENGPANYDMDIDVRGAQAGNFHVEVRNRVVMAATRDGRPTTETSWNAWSVPGMFETLSEELQIAEDPQKEIQAAPGTEWRLRCEFDSQFGFPRRYHRHVTGGPEVSWLVVRFTAK